MSQNVREVQTVCGGCHNSCSIKVILKNGEIDKIQGVPDDPRTRGTICSKGLSGKQIVNDPTRLLYPVRRAGKRGENKWERISWDEALEEVASNLNKVKEEKGPRAVGFFRGQAAGWGLIYNMYGRLAHAFGTEPAIAPTECYASRAIGQAMTYGGVPSYPDYEHANMIVCWGRQPTFSGATQLHSIFDAKERGAKLVVIDPLHFHIAAKADLFMRIEPGTDLALALAVLYVIVEKDLWDHDFVNNYTNDPGLKKLKRHLLGENREQVEYTPEWAETITGIPAGVIRQFAEELGATKGVTILTGHGLEGKVNVTQTARSIALIRLVTGNVDAPGGDLFTNMSPKLNAEFALNTLVNPDEKLPPFARLVGVPQYNPPGCTYPLLFAGGGHLPTPDVMRQIDEGEMKAVYMMGLNPLLMLPNTESVKETLSKLDFLAIADTHISETARELADLVLPAASYLERTELQCFQYDRWYPYIRLRRKVATVGEALPDWQICAKLGYKLGLEEYFPNEDVAYYTDLLLEPAGITYEQLEKAENGIKYEDIEYRKYEKEGFALPGGKAHVYAEVFEHLGYDPLPVYVESSENHRSTPEQAEKYPMLCFTGRAGPMYVHCQGRTIPWLREARPEGTALINTLKAKEMGLAEGDLIEVESPRGKITIKAKITNVVAPDVIYIPGGWADANYNQLSINDQHCVESSQANYKVCLAKIAKI